MDSRHYLQIRNFVQNYLTETRLELKYSLDRAGRILNIDESVLEGYEKGKNSPSCHELFTILKKYQADLDQFALEFALLQIDALKQEQQDE